MMIDLGVSAKKMYGPSEGKAEANRIIYPSLSIEKDIGDFKIEQKITFTCSAVVTSLRKDKQGVRTSFEVREISGSRKPTKEEAGHKAAEEFLEK